MRTMSLRQGWHWPLVALAAIGVAGCGNKDASSTGRAPADKAEVIALNKWLHELQVDVPPSTYRVEPPDAIRVHAPLIKELDNAESRLRSDGKITLNLVGEVYVAGMTPSEIAQELSKRLEKYYQKQSIYVAVDVTEFKSKQIYVFGYVQEPGIKPFTGRDMVVKVLSDAKFTNDSWPDKVVLIRPNRDRTIRQKVTIDIKKMYATGDISQNYLLEEGDMVYVPPSPLAEFRMTTEDLIAPIRPVGTIARMAVLGI